MVLIWGLICAVAHTPATAQSGREHIDPSTWWPRVEKIEEAVERGRWKSAAKLGQRLEADVLRRSWHGSELRKILTEVAFLQALAYANLDQDRRAVWLWHMAINLDFRIVKRDLSPYGKAARLLLEFPLRRKGEIPAGFDPSPQGIGVEVVAAQWPPMNATPTILNNTGAALEHHGDFHVETIIDEQGRPHQPVSISSHLHPVIVYASLKFLYDLPPFQPARVNGQPADLKMDLRIQFEVSRW